MSAAARCTVLPQRAVFAAALPPHPDPATLAPRPAPLPAARGAAGAGAHHGAHVDSGVSGQGGWAGGDWAGQGGRGPGQQCGRGRWVGCSEGGMHSTGRWQAFLGGRCGAATACLRNLKASLNERVFAGSSYGAGQRRLLRSRPGSHACTCGRQTLPPSSAQLTARPSCAHPRRRRRRSSASRRRPATTATTTIPGQPQPTA